jgi:hypothetical protein
MPIEDIKPGDVLWFPQNHIGSERIGIISQTNNNQFMMTFVKIAENTTWLSTGACATKEVVIKDTNLADGEFLCNIDGKDFAKLLMEYKPK